MSKGDLTKAIRDLAELLSSTDEGLLQLSKFVQMTHSPGWAVYKDMLLTLKGLMAHDLLSKRITSLDKDEKDVVQRVYYNTNIIIDFLLNPTQPIQGKLSLIEHNARMEADLKSRQPKKGRK